MDTIIQPLRGLLFIQSNLKTSSLSINHSTLQPLNPSPFHPFNFSTFQPHLVVINFSSSQNVLPDYEPVLKLPGIYK